MDDATNKPEEGQHWHETWTKNLSQVDDKLIELYKEASEKAEDAAEHAKAKVQEMLDKTDMDEKARANWEKAKVEGKELGAKIESRVAQLIADGKIALSKMTKKD
jgi:DNA-binding TFAR19-related protein (PDSD5 family)